MSRGIIAGSLFVLACLLAAAYASTGPGLDTNLQGKYVMILTSSNEKLILKAFGIQKLGERSFVVSFHDEANRPHYSYIPIDTINMLEVYDTLEAATGKQVREAATVKGIVTLRGKPLIGGLKFHSTDGLAYSTELNPDGTYEIRDIPPGVYVVTVDCDVVKRKFKTVTESELKVKVTDGTNAIDFALD